jgi:glycosyltransferase involved in cell wall biosynthesis
MGPSTKDVLLRDYGLADEQVLVVGAGPNMALGPVGAARPRCRRLLFVGTQWELKGGPELLSAFATLRRDVPDLELQVVGSSPEGPLPEGMSVLGRVPHEQMDLVYSRADAVVIPSHVEAFGIALLEGLSKGLPCVGTAINNQAWIIGDAGECVQPGAVDALVAALGRLIRDYPRYRHRAEVRGGQIRQQLTWDHVAEVICADLLS